MEVTQIVIDILYSIIKKGMTMDCGAPKNVVGKRWLQEFVKENGLCNEKMNPRKVNEKFLFGSGELFHANTQVDIPVSYTHLTLPTKRIV